MRSQVRFFMDVQDERAFIHAVAAEADTVLVDGPPWKTAAIPLLDPGHLPDSSYLLIWNRAEAPRLKAKASGASWEPRREEELTIQFLRSWLWDNCILCEGRIAVATTTVQAAAVERRYKWLRKLIQSTYQNEILCWWHSSGPRTEKNPSAPDTSTWVGPGALAWLRSNPRHKFKQSRFSLSEAILVAEPGRA
jgi:hypothetical protein